MQDIKEQEYKMVRILATSDTHDMHTTIDIQQLPAADIFIHTGDFTKYSRPKQLVRFREFLNQLPYKHKIVIAGNHDFVYDKARYLSHLKQTKHKHQQAMDPDEEINKLKQCCIYLEHQSVQVEGLKIFGSPFSTEFCDWGFMFNQQQAENLWKVIPEDTDILLTHGPAYGILDQTFAKIKTGCKQLLQVIKRIKPKVHIFGHIHETYGDIKVGDTHFYNASYANLHYKPTNQMHLIEVKVKLPAKQK